MYTLYGEDGKPLYVGKGSNLRTRVLAHFAAVKGGGKSREVHIGEPIGRVEWQETLGEFGAHLLELRLIHALKPQHNHRGKLSPELCSIQLETEDGFTRPRWCTRASWISVAPRICTACSAMRARRARFWRKSRWATRCASRYWAWRR